MNNELTTLKEKYKYDNFPQSLGIELIDLSPGYVKLEMTLKENMTNIHGIGHGGAIFTLADTALGLASNARSTPAVTLTISINYLSPAKIGTKLIAVAEEEYLTKRTGVYNIKITSDEGKEIALARGTIYHQNF
ncbi:MAG: acyl-CoA thioesterase [Clostridia bacterium]|nr:acyl-CoA thioesterase [Clostridia bacterium]